MTLVAVLFCGSTLIAQQATLRITGTVPQPLTLSRDEIAAMPHKSVTVPGRDQQDTYEGVALGDLLTRAGVPSGEALRGPELAKYLIVIGADGYRVVFALPEFDAAFGDRTALLADKRNGQPLPPNAAPFQLIVPGEKRPTRWVRQVVTIQVAEASTAR